MKGALHAKKVQLKLISGLQKISFMQICKTQLVSHHLKNPETGSQWIHAETAPGGEHVSARASPTECARCLLLLASTEHKRHLAVTVEDEVPCCSRSRGAVSTRPQCCSRRIPLRVWVHSFCAQLRMLASAPTVPMSMRTPCSHLQR